MFNLFKKKSNDQVEEQLKHYTDLEGVSTQDLNFGLWYHRHRKHFFIGLVSVLAVIGAILFIYSLYYFGDYLLRGMVSQQEALQGLSQDVSLRAKRLAQDSVLPRFVKVISLPNGNYDFIGTITNANEDYWLEFNYYFVVDGQPLDMQAGFVLPQEQRYLLSLNQELAQQPLQVDLVIENWQWRRLNAHEINDWQAHKEDYLNFVIQDKEFLGDDQSGLSENLRLSRLGFTVINQTPYSYYEAPFDIVIYQHNEIVGVARYVIEKFASREKRTVEISIVGDIDRATRIDVLPSVNIFNQDVIAPLEVVN